MSTVVCGTNRNNTIKKIIKFEKYEDNFAHVAFAVARHVNANVTCKQCLAMIERASLWVVLSCALILALGRAILAIFIN